MELTLPASTAAPLAGLRLSEQEHSPCLVAPRYGLMASARIFHLPHRGSSAGKRRRQPRGVEQRPNGSPDQRHERPLHNLVPTDADTGTRAPLLQNQSGDAQQVCRRHGLQQQGRDVRTTKDEGGVDAPLVGMLASFGRLGAAGRSPQAGSLGGENPKEETGGRGKAGREERES